MSIQKVEYIDKYLRSQDEKAIDQILKGVFILALIGVPLSILRVSVTGWQSANSVHILSLILVLGIFLLKNKISYRAKVWFFLALSLAVASIGLINFGIVGNGLIWAMFSLLICLLFFEKRTAYFVASYLFLILAYSFYDFAIKGTPFPGDIDLFSSSIAAWGVAVLGSAAFVILLFFSLMEQKNSTREILEQVEKQKEVISRQKLELEYRANHDILTGLATIGLASERLELVLQLANRTGQMAALLYLDLDGFKPVNDTYGHDAGDKVLIEVAKRIQSVIRSSDTACRVGGDEFIVIQGDISKKLDISTLCARIIQIINQPVNIEKQQISIGVSIGVSVYSGDTDAQVDLKSMKSRADQLMYQVKRSGKNNFKIDT